MPWLILGYPALAHLGVWLHIPHLQWLALVWLLAVSLLNPLRQGRVWAWSVLPSAAIALYLLTFSGNGLYALYIPPVVIPAAMFFACLASLRAGETPLISRIAAMMRGEPLPDLLKTYTRHVTQLWCGVSAVMIASAIGFALWATPAVWSLVTNVLHYVALAAVFALEFAYRRYKYGHLEPWGFAEFLRRLAHTKIRA